MLAINVSVQQSSLVILIFTGIADPGLFFKAWDRTGPSLNDRIRNTDCLTILIQSNFQI